MNRIAKDVLKDVLKTVLFWGILVGGSMLFVNLFFQKSIWWSPIGSEISTALSRKAATAVTEKPAVVSDETVAIQEEKWRQEFHKRTLEVKSKEEDLKELRALVEESRILVEFWSGKKGKKNVQGTK